MVILNNNYLVALAEAEKAANLDKLTLMKKEIDDISEDAFDNFVHIRILILGFNKLKRIDASQFRGLTELERLDLKHNRIDELDDFGFVDLTSLKYLNLSANKLERIESCQLDGLVSLEELWLYENRIETIDANAFRDLANLRVLRLDSNRLRRLDRLCFAAFDPQCIVLIELFRNEPELNCVSFFNRALPLPSGWGHGEKDFIESNLKSSGGFESDWWRFFKQFSVQDETEPELERNDDDKDSDEQLIVRL